MNNRDKSDNKNDDENDASGGDGCDAQRKSE